MTPEDALKRLRSFYPVHITHDENGNPLAQLPDPLPSNDVLFAEDEDELECVDDD